MHSHQHDLLCGWYDIDLIGKYVYDHDMMSMLSLLLIVDVMLCSFLQFIYIDHTIEFSDSDEPRKIVDVMLKNGQSFCVQEHAYVIN